MSAGQLCVTTCSGKNVWNHKIYDLFVDREIGYEYSGDYIKITPRSPAQAIKNMDRIYTLFEELAEENYLNARLYIRTTCQYSHQDKATESNPFDNFFQADNDTKYFQEYTVAATSWQTTPELCLLVKIKQLNLPYSKP